MARILDLAFRLFTRDIENIAIDRHLQSDLQHEGRFANARVAADQYDRTGDNSATQDAGKFTDRHGQAVLIIALNFRQTARLGHSAAQAGLAACLGRACAGGGGAAMTSSIMLFQVLQFGQRPIGARRGAPTALANIAGLNSLPYVLLYNIFLGCGAEAAPHLRLGYGVSACTHNC